MDGVHKARADGGSVTAQIAGRPVGVLLALVIAAAHVEGAHRMATVSVR